MRHMDTYGDLEDQLSHRSHGSEMSCAAHFVAPAEKAADYMEIGDGLVAQADGRKKNAVRCSDAGLRFNSSSGPVGKAVAGAVEAVKNTVSITTTNHFSTHGSRSHNNLF